MTIGQVTLCTLLAITLGGCVGDLTGSGPLDVLDAGAADSLSVDAFVTDALVASDTSDASVADASAMDVLVVRDVGVDAAIDAFDAGPVAMPDAGPDRSACPATADLFCDDFEDGIDATWNQFTRSGGRIRASSESFEGTGAVEVSISTNTGTGGSLEIDPRPWDTRAFWGRYHMRTAEAPSVHGWLIQGAGTVPGGGRGTYRLDINGGRLNSRYRHASIEEIQHGGLRKSGIRMPLNRWVCVEFFFDTENNQMRYFFDGMEDEDMRVTGAEDPVWLAPNITVLGIGLFHHQAHPNRINMYMDAIAFGTERIGCAGE